MPDTNPQDPQREEDHGTAREDEPLPSASDDVVLEETARLAREGRQAREAESREPKSSRET